MTHHRWKAGLVVVAALVSLAPAHAVLAEDDVDLGVEVRYRPETKRWLFAEDDGEAQQQFLRTRVAADASAMDKVSGHLTMQDSRTLGVPESGFPAGDTNLGVHEAYFRYLACFHPDLNFQAGRYEMSYGNERIIGPSNWSNVGARFDGFRFSLVKPEWQLDFFRNKIDERLFFKPVNSDWDLYGAYYHNQAMWDLFFLYDYDGLEIGDERNLSRFTVGAYSARRFAERFDYITNVAWQGGSMAGTDISAYLLTLELGFNDDGEHDWRAALGVDLASGDDPTDADFQAYDNLYYTGHKFRGYMDQFLHPVDIGGTSAGLMDLYLRSGFTPMSDCWAGADLHFFRFAQDPSPAVDERSLGVELDLLARVTTIRQFSTEVGGAAFFPDEDQFGPDASTEVWGYIQLTATLP